MTIEALCRCIYDASKRDRFDGKDALEAADFGPFEIVDKPQRTINGFSSYSTESSQPMRGSAIREGELWYVSSESMDKVSFSLYVNGFSFTHNGKDISMSFSPFSLVRACRFNNAPDQNSIGFNLEDFKIFKVSLFAQDINCYYGVRADDEHQAEQERSHWIYDIAKAIALVTQSLFPPFHISCDPRPDVLATGRRLMAGYLVHLDNVTVVSVLYCELHPQQELHPDQESSALFVLYENELCQTIVMKMQITEWTPCSEKVAVNCSCFCIGSHQFSARTLNEQKLWVRALSNLKVKVTNRAPAPSSEELGYYREAIKEHIASFNWYAELTVSTDALLQRHARFSSAEWKREASVSPCLARPCKEDHVSNTSGVVELGAASTDGAQSSLRSVASENSTTGDIDLTAREPTLESVVDEGAVLISASTKRTCDDDEDDEEEDVGVVASEHIQHDVGCVDSGPALRHDARKSVARAATTSAGTADAPCSVLQSGRRCRV